LEKGRTKCNVIIDSRQINCYTANKHMVIINSCASDQVAQVWWSKCCCTRNTAMHDIT